MKSDGQRRQSAAPARPQPQRTCAACRRVDAKRGLVRLVRREDGGVSVDESGKAAGRGVYLCRAVLCWELAIRRHVLERALRIDRVSNEDRSKLTVYAQQFAVTDHADDVGDERRVDPRNAQSGTERIQA